MAPDPESIALLRQDFDLPAGGMTEAELLDWLARQIEQMLCTRPDYLMSLCYTLDVDQVRLARILHPSAPAAPPLGLARLLYERQCARVRSKQAYTVPPLDSEDAW
ncbi:hypothetical protein LEM8419_02532 [Neolewinella maritima]|uniref:Uncharacterized protein n=1 Tax=Neolewinella maritima TaxID=1383882 RepID=A0ABM9B2Q5_9BACT|nr:hypothetical protein [Neolewinella maritima]CAH1001627.1 hypothetical protein LEM8419_02532 [Neolewinella maritima]